MTPTSVLEAPEPFGERIAFGGTCAGSSLQVPLAAARPATNISRSMPVVVEVADTFRAVARSPNVM